MVYMNFTDLTVDVLSLSNQQQKELNVSGVEYGLNPEDFMDLMSKDLEEAEALRIAKEHEDEKAMYSVSLECYRLVILFEYNTFNFIFF